MPKQWHKLHLFAKGERDGGYDQDLTFWVEAYGREAAVAIAMIDGHVYADSQLVSVEVLETRTSRPVDADKVHDRDR